MKDLIVFELEDGTPVYIESKDPSSRPLFFYSFTLFAF